MGDASLLNPGVEKVAAWIKRYLMAHPNATDTAEGIQRWWLVPFYGEVALVTVELALARLESEGVVRVPDQLALNPTYGRGSALPDPKPDGA